jgi:nucleotide-binding universal stress UspA family protein
VTRNFTTILVPTDFGYASDAAIGYARMLAARFGASLHLLHVVDEPGSWSEVYAAIPDIRDRLSADAARRLEALAACLPAPLHATSAVVCGAPVPGIVKEAESRGADLIVMGTHGRRGMGHLLLGSVAERVVRLAPCPVLTVREAPAETTVEVSAAAAAWAADRAAPVISSVEAST